MKPIETLLTRMLLCPFRTAFILFAGGFLCGVAAILLIHFIWLHTVFQDRMERELNKRLVYQIYQQRTCVAKWKMTRECVEWREW